MDWLLDGALSVLVLALAGSAMFTRDLLAAVMSFIAFGLVVALVWVRLSAPDLALAEAALGGGVTGALLLWAVRRLEGPDSVD